MYYCTMRFYFFFFYVPIIYYFTPPSVFFRSIYSPSPLFDSVQLPTFPCPSPLLRSHCMCPDIPPVSEEQVLTGSWHLVRPTMQRCVFALRSGGHWRPMQVHYIIPIITDWTQDWGWSVLGSGWLGLAHMPSMQEQMWSADPQLSHHLFCLSTPQADHITAVPARR